MKKYFTLNKFQKWNLSHAASSLRRKLTSQKKRKVRLKKEIGVKKGKQKKHKERKKFITKAAPANFSFIQNTEQVLNFLDELRTLFDNRKNVLIDLRNITTLTNDTIVLLSAFVNNSSILNGVEIRGNYPDDSRLRKIFIESGVFGNASDQKGRKNYILTRKNKKAEGGIAAELIKRASKEVFGEEGRCPGVYKALMECMANTCYHAKPKQIAKETWWLTVYHEPNSNHVCFAFIDLGVGIFKSSKMNDFKAKAASMLGLSDNIDILKEILSGRKLSSTKIPYRGKGLPIIYKGLERNYYSNLKLISNDVKADLAKNQFSKIKNEFSGTFLYFELNTTNRWIK